MCCRPSTGASHIHAHVQALLLKASVAPTEATASVAMEAVSMLRQAPSRYEVLSMAAQLLQRMPLTDRASAGVSLRVSMRACTSAGMLVLLPHPMGSWLMLRQLADVLCHPGWRSMMCRCLSGGGAVTSRVSCGSRGCKHCPLSVQELLPLVEPNLAARSQAVRGATLRLLCACAQPLVPQQKSSSKEDEAPSSGEPQRLSSIFPGLAQIESQVCMHHPTLRLPRVE